MALQLDGYAPFLSGACAEHVNCDDLDWCVFYRQGSYANVVAVFCDAEDAQLAADAMNHREGVLAYQVAKLVEEA